MNILLFPLPLPPLPSESLETRPRGQLNISQLNHTTSYEKRNWAASCPGRKPQSLFHISNVF